MMSRRRAGPWLRLVCGRSDPHLERTVFGVRFPNPIGLAAGFGKAHTIRPASRRTSGSTDVARRTATFTAPGSSGSL